MARLTGKNGSVLVDGAAIAHVTGWALDYNPQIHEHYGAGMSGPSRVIDYTDASGSIDVESNPDDSTQAALLGDAQSVTLILREDGSTSHEIAAIIWGGVRLARGGKVTRSFSFRKA